jgi:hypothetical protein
MLDPHQHSAEYLSRQRIARNVVNAEKMLTLDPSR